MKPSTSNTRSFEPPLKETDRDGESGNILIMVLIAIVLIGLLTAALQQSGGDGANIDPETLTIRVSEVQRTAAELERAVQYVMQNGPSETDLRFAIPTDNSTEYGDITTTPQWQIFHTSGGAATYRNPPAGIQTTPSPWEFYGTTAIPGAATAKPELIAVLPNVTQGFCERVNSANGQTDSQPEEDGAGCINGGATERFGTAFYDDASPNTLDAATFTKTPAMQACVECSGVYHFYHVLNVR